VVRRGYNMNLDVEEEILHGRSVTSVIYKRIEIAGT
jgi:hypothetical protein